MWVGRIPLLSWPVCACSSSFPSFPIMLDYKYSVAKFTHPLVSVCTPWWPKTFWFPQLQGQTRLSTYYIREVSITKYIPSTQLDRWYLLPQSIFLIFWFWLCHACNSNNFFETNYISWKKMKYKKPSLKSLKGCVILFGCRVATAWWLLLKVTSYITCVHYLRVEILCWT